MRFYPSSNSLEPSLDHTSPIVPLSSFEVPDFQSPIASPTAASISASDDTIRTAITIESPSQVIRGFVGQADRVDFYRFVNTENVFTKLTLDGLSRDADIDLIQDVNGNGTVDFGEIIRTSDEALDRPELIELSTLGSGEYYLRVQSPFGADTDYRLALTRKPNDPGDTFITAGELGIITGQKTIQGNVLGTNFNDIYGFTLLDPADLQITLSGNPNLYLAQDKNENGAYNIGETIASTRLPIGELKSIAQSNLAPGRYFIVVEAVDNGSTYDLNITSDIAGATRDTAKYLGGFSTGSTTIREYSGGDDYWDLYRFRLNTAADTKIQLSQLSGNVDMYLYQDTNRNGSFDTSEFRAAQFTEGKVTEEINLAGLAAGEYTLVVTTLTSKSASSYRLDLQTTAINRQRRVSGTLGNETFTIGTERETIISGNGNYYFGLGRFDILDLSNVNRADVTFNRVGVEGGTGITLDLDQSPRQFDEIRLQNGQRIFFEGIDRITFRDQSLDLGIIPNDPLFNQQWGLHMMGVQNAWRFGTGTTQVAIGVADSGLGVDSAGGLHPDLRREGLFAVNSMEVADDYRYEYSNGYVEFDEISHGTAVQGVIGAQSNNREGIAGINWNSNIVAVDVLGNNLGDEDLAAASAALISGRRSPDQRMIVNMSLGRLPFTPAARDRELEAVIAANPNVLFVIASGNENRSSLSEPAALARKYRNVIAVGAAWGPFDANPNDNFVNYQPPGTRISYPPVRGEQWGSNYGEGLTLMGPSELYSLESRQGFSGSTFGYWSSFGGTSAATPNVAGVASLVWSANPNLSASQVKQILSKTAVDVASPGYDRDTGHGFVNADAAVRSAIAYAV